MARQIEINYKNESGYEVLYPNILSSGIIFDEQTIQDSEAYRFSEIQTITSTDTVVDLIYDNGVYYRTYNGNIQKGTDGFSWENVSFPAIPPNGVWGRSFSSLQKINEKFYTVGVNNLNYYIYVGDGDNYTQNATFSSGDLFVEGFLAGGDKIFLLLNGKTSGNHSTSTNIYYYSTNNGNTWTRSNFDKAYYFSTSGPIAVKGNISIANFQTLTGTNTVTNNNGYLFFDENGTVTEKNIDCEYIVYVFSDSNYFYSEIYKNRKYYLVRSENGLNWEELGEIKSASPVFMTYNGIYLFGSSGDINITKDFESYFYINYTPMGGGSYHYYYQEDGIYCMYANNGIRGKIKLISFYWLEDYDSLGKALNELYYKMNYIETNL